MRDDILINPLARSERAEADREHGTVKTYILARGFGFIATDAGPDIFFHVNALTSGQTHIAVGDRVSFDVATSSRSGKPEAVNVRIEDAA